MKYEYVILMFNFVSTFCKTYGKTNILENLY